MAFDLRACVCVDISTKDRLSKCFRLRERGQGSECVRVVHHIIKVGKSSIINRLTGRKVAARVRCLARRNSCLHSGEKRIQTPEWTAGPDQETHLAQDWWFQDLALGKFRRVSLSLSSILRCRPRGGTRSSSFWMPPGSFLSASEGASQRQATASAGCHRVRMCCMIMHLVCLTRVVSVRAIYLDCVRSSKSYSVCAASSVRRLRCPKPPQIPRSFVFGQHVDRQQTGYDLVTRLGKVRGISSL